MANSVAHRLLATFGLLLQMFLLALPRDLRRCLTMRARSVKGELIAITGAASGIGQRLAQILAEQGAIIALIDTNQVTLN